MNAIENHLLSLSSGHYRPILPFKIEEFDMIARAMNTMIETVQEREQMVKNERAFTQMMLDTQQSLVIVTDGRDIQVVNKAFFHVFPHYDSLEAFKQNHRCICDFFDYVDNSEFLYKNVDERWMEKIIETPDKQFKAKMTLNGTVYIFNVTAAAMPSNDLYVATFNDITELETYKNSLEERVNAQVTKERMHEAILFEHSRFSAISRTISMIAHHWRQPLNAIGIIAQDILDAKRYGELDEEYLENAVAKSMQLISNMSQMIDRFRIMSLDTEAPRKREISWCVSEVSQLLSLELSALNITFIAQYFDNFSVKDSVAMSQVLLNLITNATEVAVKRDIPMASIVVTTRQEERMGFVMVEDNCGGIEEQTLETLFQPYVSHEHHKAGLGLFLTRLMLEKSLNGHITAKNVDEGALFTITIPL